MGRLLMRGVLGLRAQRMVTKPTLTLRSLGYLDVSTGSGSVTAPADCIAFIYGWGARGGGARSSVAASGSGGGGAFYRRVRLSKGQVVTYSVGAPGAEGAVNTDDATDGGPTTVTLSSGLAMTANGGGRGRYHPTAAPATLGGTALGGELNRRGGGGGSGTSIGPAVSPGADGEFGSEGTAGLVSGSSGLGGAGGAGGFSDLPGIVPLSGAAATPPNGGLNTAGLGGGGAADGSGRVLIVLVKP